MKREPLTHLPKHFAALVLGLKRTLLPDPALCGTRRREWIVYSLQQATCDKCRTLLRHQLLLARAEITAVISDTWRARSFASVGGQLVPVHAEPFSAYGWDVLRDHRPPEPKRPSPPPKKPKTRRSSK